MQGDQKRQLYFRTQLFKIISVVFRDMSILVDFVDSTFFIFWRVIYYYFLYLQCID